MRHFGVYLIYGRTHISLPFTGRWKEKWEDPGTGRHHCCFWHLGMGAKIVCIFSPTLRIRANFRDRRNNLFTWVSYCRIYSIGKPKTLQKMPQCWCLLISWGLLAICYCPSKETEAQNCNFCGEPHDATWHLVYPLVIWHSYGKWIPIKNVFPFPMNMVTYDSSSATCSITSHQSVPHFTNKLV